MKKMYFFALAAAGLMTACSSDDAVSNGGGADETALVPIQIGVSPVSVTTRGTGTVGSTAGDNNKWAGQTINIYMFDKGTLTPAQFCYGPDDTPFDIYNNTKFTAPSDAANGVAKDATGKINYYPINGKFDFWGYRIDDATLAETTSEEDSIKTDGNGKKALYKTITINGSQDVMGGKATLDTTDELGDQAANYFSAYSARKGVQPTISFAHKLTRFTFTVVPGNKSAAGKVDEDEKIKGVKILGISVNTPTKATLPVAWEEGYADDTNISFDAESAADLKLMQRSTDASANDNLVGLEAVDLQDKWSTTDGKGVEVAAGEALLVAPGQEAYSMTVNLSQTVPVWETGKVPDGQEQYQEVKTVFTKDIKLNSGAFQPGYSYNVKITVYGLEKIEVSAELQPWKVDEENKTIEIDSDSDDEATDDNTDSAGGDGSVEEV